MAYLGDIRENRFGPNGELWEEDNRIEERHYWNGAFIDLCGLSAEDYAKTIFVTSGSGSSDTPSKQNNPITVQETEYVNENGEILYAYRAIAKQEVTSEVVIEMSVVDSFGASERIIIKIPMGSSESEIVPTSTFKQEGFDSPNIEKSNYSPKEDEMFKYNTILPEKPVIKPVAYSITLKKGEIDFISDDELIIKILNSEQLPMMDNVTSETFIVDFSKNSVPVEGFSNMSIPEMDVVLIENSQDIILVTDKPIKTIAEAVSNIPETELWKKRENNITINGKSYAIWYKRDEGQTTQSSVFDPETNEMVSADSAKYIIYYE